MENFGKHFPSPQFLRRRFLVKTSPMTLWQMEAKEIRFHIS
jgi:hypothetical protein